MEPSIFTKIIRGEIPAHKVYEDDKTLAFMDILPTIPGDVLIVSKTQVERLEDLSDDDYAAVMQTVRKVMRRMNEVFGPEYRACAKVMGFDVPHAHVHVLPCRNGQEFHQGKQPTAPDHDALGLVADRLRF
jgi:histidine triad (HIT) family protein